MIPTISFNPGRYDHIPLEHFFEDPGKLCPDAGWRYRAISPAEMAEAIRVSHEKYFGELAIADAMFNKGKLRFVITGKFPNKDLYWSVTVSNDRKNPLLAHIGIVDPETKCLIPLYERKWSTQRAITFDLQENTDTTFRWMKQRFGTAEKKIQKMKSRGIERTAAIMLTTEMKGEKRLPWSAMGPMLEQLADRSKGRSIYDLAVLFSVAVQGQDPTKQESLCYDFLEKCMNL